MKKSILILILSLILIMEGGILFANGQGEKSYPDRALDFVAPAGAGGGWDLTIRVVANVLKETGLVKVPMVVRNNPGAGGAVNLSEFQQMKGSDNALCVYSPPIILINLNGTTDLSYEDLTPLARLIADYAVFVVPADSEYKTMADVFDKLKEDPKSVKIGGGSSVGSMDHIQFLIMAKAAGVKDLKQIDYVSFDIGGSAQVLGGHIDLFSTGLSEVLPLIESGDLRALAQTADHRVGKGLIAEVPTCIEQGINATFVNWRGLFGPPQMPDYAVEYWRETLSKMVKTPEWEKARKTYGWDDAYLDAPEFKKFLGEVNEEYRKILADIGMLK